MQEINNLIKEKLMKYNQDVRELSAEALKMAELGFSDAQMAQMLPDKVKKIIKKME